MHNILRLPGARALSAFRLDKLLRQAREALPKLSGIRAQHWHFVKLVRPLAASEQEVLEKLLTYGPSSGHEDLHDAIVLVVPRLGTISPWSSKATDIAHACGLDAVERIERGMGVRFELPAGVVLDAVARRSLLPLIHDRMTETVLSSLAEADALFRHAKPQPLTAGGSAGPRRRRAGRGEPDAWAWRCRRTRSPTSTSISPASGAIPRMWS